MLNRFRKLPDNTRGGLILLIAALGFSLMAVLIKIAGTSLHVTQILLVRQLGMFALLIPVLMRSSTSLLTSRRPLLHIARIGFALVAMLCGFSAVINMPLADAVALGFTKGLFVTVFKTQQMLWKLDMKIKAEQDDSQEPGA